jgi:acetylornithine deacetylase/succinyl-diaminopimelate desuccinylase-like protein
MKRLIEEARRMIETKSISSEGNEELVGFLSQLLKDRGLEVKTQQVFHSLEGVSKRQYNILGIMGDSLVDRTNRRGLLLVSHLDTVPPGVPAHWSKTNGNPYRTELDEGRLYGLGVADSKVDFLAKLYAILQFREKKLKMPIYLAGTCGEELGMFGCRYLMESFWVNPSYTLIGKPTGLKLVTSHPSHEVLQLKISYPVVDRDARGFNRRIKLKATGKTAHSAHPDEGVNALSQVIDFLNYTQENGFELRMTQLLGGSDYSQMPDEAFSEFFLTSHQYEDFKRFFRESLQGTDQNLEIDYGGLGDTGISFLHETILDIIFDLSEAIKEISFQLAEERDERFSPPVSNLRLAKVEQRQGETLVRLDLRLLPQGDQRKQKEKVMANLKKMGTRYPQMNIQAEFLSSHPSLQNGNAAWTTLCKESLAAADIDPGEATLPFSTEAGYFEKRGYPALVFGPGDSRGNVHGVNESLPLKDIQKVIQFYENLIERVCL